jgi:hypothetical protein
MPETAAYYLQPLSWHQVGSRPERYELRAIPGRVASLTFRSRYEAVAEGLGASWLFLRKGIFRRSAEVWLLPSSRHLATCRLGFWNSAGSLQLPSGLSLNFSASTWDKSYLVKTDGGALVLSYDFRGFFSLRAPLVWGNQPSPAEELPWLVPFGWFLAVRYYRDVVEAAGAVVVSG